MKILFTSLVLALLGFQAFAECPRLEGNYGCSVSADQVAALRVKRFQTDSVTLYNLTYGNGEGADSFRASAAGVRDDFGWMNRCTSDNRLVSTKFDGSATGAIYLDPRHSWIREYNGVIVQTCWRQN